MSIKLIALDLDGTLLTSSKTIDEVTKNKLIEAQRLGIKIVIATGRDKGSISFVSDPLELEKGNNFVAGMNGQIIYDFENKKYYVDDVLGVEDAKKVMRLGKKMNFEVISCCGYDHYDLVSRSLKLKKNIRRWLFGEPIDYGFKKGKQRFFMIHDCEYEITKDINKFVLIQTESYFKKNLPKIRTQLKDYDIYEVAHDWIEVMPRGVSKGSAITKIAQQYNISKDEMMAFGDAENDISMFDSVKYSIAMGNAMDTLKDKAYDVTDTNDQQGIAKALDKYIFNSCK